MQTLGFGVTKRAALANTAAVCGRSTFHSEQRCTEQLCRQVGFILPGARKQRSVVVRLLYSSLARFTGARSEQAESKTME